MNRRLLALGVACLAWLPGSPAAAGPRGEAGQLGSILKRAEQIRELQITDEDEVRLGEAVSEKIRVRYGVVQDQAVHRYVGLVGAALVQSSTRPGLPFRFIVLDTDGVNAFAAPGGFIHITRGALALVANEAELAGVLGHELIHVTEKHTLKAIQKGKMIQMGANETLSGNAALFSQLVDKTADLVLAGFGRSEELESDERGIRLANAVGYAPGALATFLTRLSDRNQSATGKQGLFASHPEMQERLDKMAGQIAAEHLASSVTLEQRYRKYISYTPKAQAEIATVAAGAAGLTGGSGGSATASGAKGKGEAGTETGQQDETKKKKGFGLGGLLRPGDSEKKSAEVTGSAASRGVDTERGAKGGPVSTAVAVALTPADVAAFKKEGKLR
jgi:beta-barrel assembly-enhancing protease